MAKYFAVEKKRAWVDLYDLDDVFYNNPENGYLKFYENAYEGIIHAYNHLRNFLTKKLFSEYKWKLNFENPTLADGFDKNKEPDNSTVILRKENRYYLGVMKKGYNHLFSDRNEKKFTFQTGREGYKKMIYKQIANPAFDIHNLAITEKGVQRFTKLKNKEKYWSPVDVYVGGAEHATRHLIYARFWHKFLYDIKEVSQKEPFQNFRNVGLILAPDGKKMSKRYGNVINPDDIVKTWGADTLRVYEMFMGPFEQAISWSTDNIIIFERYIMNTRIPILSANFYSATRIHIPKNIVSGN